MNKKLKFKLIFAGMISVLWTGSAAHGDEFHALELESVPLNEAQLLNERGMADMSQDIGTVMLNNGEQNAVLQDNKLQSDMTGNNSIGVGAFSGTSGITTLIQNSGNQVVIQDTTMVNVLFQQ